VLFIIGIPLLAMAAPRTPLVVDPPRRAFHPLPELSRIPHTSGSK